MASPSEMRDEALGILDELAGEWPEGLPAPPSAPEALRRVEPQRFDAAWVEAVTAYHVGWTQATINLPDESARLRALERIGASLAILLGAALWRPEFREAAIRAAKVNLLGPLGNSELEPALEALISRQTTGCFLPLLHDLAAALGVFADGSGWEPRLQMETHTIPCSVELLRPVLTLLCRDDLVSSAGVAPSFFDDAARIFLIAEATGHSGGAARACAVARLGKMWAAEAGDDHGVRVFDGNERRLAAAWQNNLRSQDVSLVIQFERDIDAFVAARRFGPMISSLHDMAAAVEAMLWRSRSGRDETLVAPTARHADAQQNADPEPTPRRLGATVLIVLVILLVIKSVHLLVRG